MLITSVWISLFLCWFLLHILEHQSPAPEVSVGKHLTISSVKGPVFVLRLYCLLLFGGCDKGEIEALQILKNKAARIITSSGIRTDRHQLISGVGWMTVRQLIYYHNALTTFRIRMWKEPEYLNDIMNRNNRSNKIVVPNSTLSLAMKSYCFRGANDWNKLPEDIRNYTKIGDFKRQLKAWILKNVPQFYDWNCLWFSVLH